ncbi:MAG: AI-2E family transporter [Oscillospiraceae bacterium]|nr:AI-2E family transporter [Oscillospiraceae bacterium]
MLATGPPYELLVTLVVSVTNIIPTFGPIVGAVIGGLLILLVKPVGVIWFLIYTVISQTLDGSVIKPILFGDTTGLRPLWVLAAIIVGGSLFGIAGMLMGIPVTAIVSSILEEHISAHLKRRGYDNEGSLTLVSENEKTTTVFG